MRTDSQLQNDVLQEIKWDPGLRHIAVTAKDGAVTLMGHVSSYFEKIRAVSAVEHVYGVKAIADEIEIRVRGTHERDDSDIAESIARILEWNAMLENQHIQAKVVNGLVTLSGEVDSNREREEATSSVHRVLGVKALTNRITVKPRVTTTQVERQITNALARHAALDARQIHVTTNVSTAILAGHVHSLDEARIARNAAWSAPGISTVKDHLVVEP